MAFPANIDPERPSALDLQKLAFAAWISNMIAKADGALDLSEIRMLTAVFPNELMQAVGLIDEHAERTDRYQQVLRDAIRNLPGALSVEEKLELVTVFHRFCMADDVLKQAELLIVREAAEALGLSVRQLSDHLNRLREADRRLPSTF